MQLDNTLSYAFLFQSSNVLVHVFTVQGSLHQLECLMNIKLYWAVPATVVLYPNALP